MKRELRSRLTKGSTLMELMIAASITGIILTGVYTLWASMAKTWMSEGVKVELNQSARFDNRSNGHPLKRRELWGRLRVTRTPPSLSRYICFPGFFHPF